MLFRECRRIRRTLFAVSCSAVLAGCAVSELNSPRSTADLVRVTGVVTKASVMQAQISGQELVYDAEGNIQLRRTLHNLVALSDAQSFATRGAAVRLVKALDSVSTQYLSSYNRVAPKAARAEEVATILFAAPIVHAIERKRLVGETGVDTIWDKRSHEVRMVFHGVAGAPPTVIEAYDNGRLVAIQTSNWVSVDGGWILSSSRMDLLIDGAIRWSVIAGASDISLVDAPRVANGSVASDVLPCDTDCDDEYEERCGSERFAWATALAIATSAKVFADYACFSPALYTLCSFYQDQACSLKNTADRLRDDLDACLNAG